jgi:hypothetical protein
VSKDLISEIGEGQTTMTPGLMTAPEIGSKKIVDMKAGLILPELQ